MAVLSLVAGVSLARGDKRLPAASQGSSIKADHAGGFKFSRLPEPLRGSDFQSQPAAKVKLGRLLFYDPVLSGSYRVSCATCHHHDRASSNGLPIVNKTADQPDAAALPDLSPYLALRPSARHAPALFNLGHSSFKALFWGGRVAQGHDGRLITPAGASLPAGLDGVLAAQALFPAVTRDELVGTVRTDLAARADAGGEPAIWAALVERVAALDAYTPLFRAAYPQSNGQMTISGIANAIGAFVATEWRADQSPYDAFLRGNVAALTASQRRGLAVFYGPGGCASCHAGALQSDQRYHAVGLPLWPVTVDLKTDEKQLADVLLGRARATGREVDRFRFRTPSLRNIAVTAPYGHAGSFPTLPEFLNAHISPTRGLRRFLRTQFGARPPQVVADLAAELVARNTMPNVRLTQQQKADLLAFLNSLTDQRSLAGVLGKPTEVPSNLSID
ncbi:MAG: cytochrome c peroxidase [Pseudomonadota bacterium]